MCGRPPCLDLPVSAVVEGPAVLEQPDATILVPPGQRGRVDAFGNIVLERVLWTLPAPPS